MYLSPRLCFISVNYCVVYRLLTMERGRDTKDLLSGGEIYREISAVMSPPISPLPASSLG